MRASSFRCAIWLAITMIGSGSAVAEDGFGIGRTATAEEIAGWDIDVSPDGKGLPPGRGGVTEGKAVYAGKCAVCHGDMGQGKPMDQLVGGQGTIDGAKPVKTVGSYWPYATTLYDFIHRAMPFNAPQSLSPNEVYAVCAYLLFLNHIVAEDAVLDAKSLPAIEMPMRKAFMVDHLDTAR
jgi:S-disulfanyl-L-cysteine oxidoreductase SoxD